jgi:dUTP pyrophosphatase
MQKTRGFEKISLNQYKKDLGGGVGYNSIKLPRRATAKSSGYDIYSIRDFKLEPGEEIKLPSGIKVYMQDNEEFLIFPRSSVGFKYKIKIDNTIGKIDADYYNNQDNEGHIWIKLTNTGNKTWEVKQGEAIVQGTFYNYLITDNDIPVSQERIGGIGSTN